MEAGYLPCEQRSIPSCSCKVSWLKATASRSAFSGNWLTQDLCERGKGTQAFCLTSAPLAGRAAAPAPKVHLVLCKRQGGDRYEVLLLFPFRDARSSGKFPGQTRPHEPRKPHILRGLRGLREGFGQTLARIFLNKLRHLPTPCEGCEGFRARPRKDTFLRRTSFKAFSYIHTTKTLATLARGR